MAAKKKLFTTGYAGHDLGSFLTKLENHGIEVVVDVRRNPVSRKRGFSRSRLSEFLSDNDIQYLHVRNLGVPEELRARLRGDECTLTEYLIEFRSHLATQDESLDELYTLATQKTCCLICVEHESSECHRSVVADELLTRNGRRLEIVHV